MAVLVTGGAGYIGSHMVLVLLEAGYEVVVLDNFSGGSRNSLVSVEKLSGRKVNIVKGDIRDIKLLDSLFADWDIDSVLHFAGLKCVSDSIGFPLDYYDNNVVGTLRLLNAMKNSAARRIVFSSSANVYGNNINLPLREFEPIAPTNPYGFTKSTVERILEDLHRSDSSWNIAILRYFNPVGAHPSGFIGEEPTGIPTNIMPYIAQVAAGIHKYLKIFGDDYGTPDGTGIRDFIHVMDLVEGHLAALNALKSNSFLLCNLGTGVGHSVLELVKTFSRVNSVEIPYTMAPRRTGDIPSSYANPELAQKILGWRSSRTLVDMCRDQWTWQKHCANRR